NKMNIKMVSDKHWDHIISTILHCGWILMKAHWRDDKKIKKMKEFRTYIHRNWERIIDWWEWVENPPKDARSLGAMESNQRRVTYRMKKRGMHWSQSGAEAMVKIKQGILNGTLRDVYLKDQRRTSRKQRELKRTVKKAQNLHQPTRPS